MKIKFNLLFVILLVCFLMACSEKTDFEISNFNPTANYENSENGVKILSLDYTYAIDSGFVIPSIRQTENGKFKLSFKIKITSGSSQEFFYKIFYRNETYKFDENRESDLPFTDENFYGSWENTDIEFKSTGMIKNDDKLHEIIDYFRIVGNPRNEDKYIIPRTDDRPVSPEEIDQKTNEIKNNEEWYNSIKEKAAKNNIDVDQQLYLDAVYVIKEYYKNTPYNQRWMRNPRVGNYSFYLVVVTKNELEKIPDYIKNIHQQAKGKYFDPYVYLKDEGKYFKALKVENGLKVKAQPDLSRGIYIEKLFKNMDTTAYHCNCNQGWKTYKNAGFQQFIHHKNDSLYMSNIPVIMDVTSNDFNKKKYESFKNKYDKKLRIKNNIEITKSPCKTVYYDSTTQSIVMVNPASKNGNYRKENVGIISRNGLTYGKYIAKVKLPELLNQSNVWNGLTNAIWLIYQYNEENTRRICNKGFIPRDKPLPAKQRSISDNYSEIDFEIVKTSQNWPNTSYIDKSLKIKTPDKDDDVIVTCTNWDLACPDPVNFGVGAYKINYKDTFFIAHRWDEWYQASTIKTPANDDELFASDYYYFEIEWKPKEIIWSIGPSKDNMKVVGYMNSDYTVIPNNQMLLTITQEYHLAKWWPMAPFSQNNIPFPAKEIKGYFYELTIE